MKLHQRPPPRPAGRLPLGLAAVPWFVRFFATRRHLCRSPRPRPRRPRRRIIRIAEAGKLTPRNGAGVPTTRRIFFWRPAVFCGHRPGRSAAARSALRRIRFGLTRMTRQAQQQRAPHQPLFKRRPSRVSCRDGPVPAAIEGWTKRGGGPWKLVRDVACAVSATSSSAGKPRPTPSPSARCCMAGSAATSPAASALSVQRAVHAVPGLLRPLPRRSSARCCDDRERRAAPSGTSTSWKCWCGP